MNARAYFTILRPGRTLVVAPIYVGFVFVWLHTLFHVSRPEMFLLALALIGPAIVGSLLLGPLQEVMHRSVFPLLPDARRHLRRFHLRALATTSVLFLLPAGLLVADIPLVALYGLIVAALSIPLLNSRRRSWGMVRPQFLLLILGGIVLTATARPALINLCKNAPWGVLIAGLGSAYACFRIGFAPSFVRNRWRDPVLYCFQSVMPFVGRDMMLHSQAQMRQLTQERNTKSGQEWSILSVGTSLRDWTRVVHHARFGGINRIRLPFRLGLLGALLVPLFFGVSFGMAKLSGDARSLSELCHLLVDAGKVGGSIKHPLLGNVLTTAPVFAYGICLLVAMMATAPVTIFPISRTRITQCLLLDAGRLAALVYVSYLLGTTLSFATASWIAEVPFECGMLCKPVAVAMLLPPAILLGLATCFVRNTAVRLVASTVIAVGTLFGSLVVVMKFAALVLSPLGLLLCGASTVFAGWLCWVAATRYFHTCDLNQPCSWFRKLGIGLA